jgi:hypothetical protein
MSVTQTVMGAATVVNLSASAAAPHQTRDMMPATGLSQVQQIKVHLAISIHSATLKPEWLHEFQQALVFMMALTIGMMPPCEIAAGVNFEHFYRACAPDIESNIAQ